MNVILLSTLVAVLTTTYEELRSKSRIVWAWTQYDVILEGTFGIQSFLIIFDFKAGKSGKDNQVCQR